MSPFEGQADAVSHRHKVVRHRHPDWHGHCRVVEADMGLGRYITFHRCTRWHFHFWFKHAHGDVT